LADAVEQNEEDLENDEDGEVDAEGATKRVVPLGAPDWTELGEKQGQDPLGMQALCISLYQSLVPGISNVTLRVRYYGFYAWLSWRYSVDVRDDSVAEWRRYLRRAEALCALISRHANPSEGGISGSIWARRLLRSDQDVLEFHPATDQEEGVTQYLRQDNGAFGAAYGSQVEEIGLLEKNGENHKIPLASKDGMEFARVYAESVGAAGEKFLKVAAAGVVSRAELTELAPMSFGYVVGAERQAYETLLFGEPSKVSETSKRRRLTLELVLRLTGKLGRELNARDIRWAAYSGRTADGELLELPGEVLGDHRFRWFVYHANDLLHMAYEGLFKFTLQRLSKHPAGLRPETLLRYVVTDLVSDWADAAGTWRQLTDRLELSEDAWSKSERLSEYRLAYDVLESAGPKAECTVEAARAAILLLAVLSKRLEPLAEQCTEVLGPSALHPYVQSLHSELRFFEQHADVTLTSVLQTLLTRRIIDRHLWVAFQKLRFQRGYTFLLESQDGLLRTRKVDGPVLTNPRLESTVDFLRDIGLVERKGLTAAGRCLVETL